jgi:uncharacterized membrane protein
MKTYLVAWVSTLIVFTGIDFVWLSRMADVIYRPAMGDMVLSTFRIGPAVAFYLIYTAGLTWIAVRPALASGAWTAAFVDGAIVGLVAYATYDLTNQATLKHWSTTLTLVDVAWGTLLSGVAAAAAAFIASRFAQS